MNGGAGTEFLGERNSSRVLAAPGGNSSMASIFGGGAPAAPPAPRAMPAPAAAPTAMPAQQPVAGARVQLRTEHTGIEVGNVSSRVLAAPGGASSMGSLLGGQSASDRIAALKARREAAEAPLADATNAARPF